MSALNEKLDTREKLLFGLIFAGLLLRMVFAPPIWNRGEAREGLVVQGIVHNQQWLLPLRNGELPSKPPLFHWIAASASLLVGESDFSTRLPSAIGAGAMVVFTFLLGRAMAGKRTGWLAVGALLGTYDFWHSAGQARVDMIFSASVTAAIAGFYFWYRDGNPSARAGFYFATVCAVLSKGPVGIALVGLAIVGFLGLEKRLPSFFGLWSPPLVAAALIVIGGWYGFAYAVGGEKFLALQVAHENLDRFIGGEAFPRHNMYLDMAKRFATRTLPWNLALLWSAIRWLRGRQENSDGRMLHAWWLAMFSLFALAAARSARRSPIRTNGRSSYIVKTVKTERATPLLPIESLKSNGKRSRLFRKCLTSATMRCFFAIRRSCGVCSTQEKRLPPK